MKLVKILSIIIFAFLLSACRGEVVQFTAGDKEEVFCGAFINYQYCECSSKELFCEEIAMTKSEAEDFVEESYQAWLESERLKFKSNCERAGAKYEKEKCRYCPEGKRLKDEKCLALEDLADQKEGVTEGQCGISGSCGTECDGNVMWQLGCNGVTNTCERTFDTDCSTNFNTFADMQFSMVCLENRCSRNDEEIRIKRTELVGEREKLEEEKNTTNAVDDDIVELNKISEEICNDEEFDLQELDLKDYSSSLGLGLEKIGFDRDSTQVAFDEDLLDALLDIESSDESEYKDEGLKTISCSINNIFTEGLEKSENKDIAQRIKEIEDSLNALPIIN